MKLLRIGEPGRERPAAIDGTGVLRDLSAHISDVDATALSDSGLAALRRLNLDAQPIVLPGSRIGPCVANVGKFICIGLNYVDHAAEAGMALPEEPPFLKATSSISGPTTTWSCRKRRRTAIGKSMGFVIGRRRRTSRKPARWPTLRDISPRTMSRTRFPVESRRAVDEREELRYVRTDRTWLVTADEVPDPQKLKLHLAVNGETMQSARRPTWCSVWRSW